MANAAQPIRAVVDDGRLHPRPKDAVFAGAPRGPVAAPDERQRIDRDTLLGLQGAQLLGAAAVTLLACWIVIRAVLAVEPGATLGVALVVAVLVPPTMRGIRRVQAESEFWHAWRGSRGFEHVESGPGPDRLPTQVTRSPLLGGAPGCVVVHAARRTILERETFVGVALRMDASVGSDEPTPLAFVVMPLPPVAATRWPAGASIRADHHASRSPAFRAMLGPITPAAFADCRAHLAAAPDQDPAPLQQLVDPGLDDYLAGHPIDADVVSGLLVVTRDGDPWRDEHLDELVRDSLVLHELLVPARELPVATMPASASAPEPEPVVDRSREGWGEGDAQQYRAA